MKLSIEVGYNATELFRHYFRTCLSTCMHGYYSKCPISFSEGISDKLDIQFSSYLYIYYNPSVNNLIHKQCVHFLKRWLQNKKNKKTKQKSEIRSSRLLIVTHMNGIQQKFVTLFLSVCHCWWKSVHSSRRLVQSLHMTVPIFRAQAAVSDHTLQRDNVGQGMLSRWVAAYLF